MTNAVKAGHSGKMRLLLDVTGFIPYGVGIGLLRLVLNNRLLQRTLFSRQRRDLMNFMMATGVRVEPRSALVRQGLANGFMPWVVRALCACDEPTRQRWMRVENESILDEAKARGKGVLVVNCHTGVSRLVPWLLMRKWDDVSAMEPEPWLAGMGVKDGERVRSISMRGSGEQFFWLRQLFIARKDLSSARSVHVAMDGLQGTGGKEWHFLGRARLYHVGLPKMALALNVPIVQSITSIDEAGRITVRYEDPLTGLTPEMDADARMACFLAGYLTNLEAFWLKDPGNIQNRHLRHYLASEPHSTENGTASNDLEMEPETSC